MKKLLLAVLLLVSACATPRTKWSDKNMRIMIDPTNMPAAQYFRLQAALVQSGKWTVIDRHLAFNAIKREQERQFKDEKDRFADREKWAHWGKLYGIGAVVVAYAKCSYDTNFWGSKYQECQQNIAIVDANTAEIIVSYEGKERGEQGQTPSWEKTVDAFNDVYPKKFVAEHKLDPILENYKDESAELAWEEEQLLKK